MANHGALSDVLDAITAGILLIVSSLTLHSELCTCTYPRLDDVALLQDLFYDFILVTRAKLILECALGGSVKDSSVALSVIRDRQPGSMM